MLLQGRRSRPDAFGSKRINLPDEVDHRSNVAVFQLTAALPFAVDFVFTGSLSPVRVRLFCPNITYALRAHSMMTKSLEPVCNLNGVSLSLSSAWSNSQDWPEAFLKEPLILSGRP